MWAVCAALTVTLAPMALKRSYCYSVHEPSKNPFSNGVSRPRLFSSRVALWYIFKDALRDCKSWRCGCTTMCCNTTSCLFYDEIELHWWLTAQLCLLFFQPFVCHLQWQTTWSIRFLSGWQELQQVISVIWQMVWCDHVTGLTRYSDCWSWWPPAHTAKYFVKILCSFPALSLTIGLAEEWGGQQVPEWGGLCPRQLPLCILSPLENPQIPQQAPLSTAALPRMLQWSARSLVEEGGLGLASQAKRTLELVFRLHGSGGSRDSPIRSITMTFRKSWRTDGSIGLLPLAHVLGADVVLLCKQRSRHHISRGNQGWEQWRVIS